MYKTDMLFMLCLMPLCCKYIKHILQDSQNKFRNLEVITWINFLAVLKTYFERYKDEV